jgi:L-iditol 2-dehydrogenase
MKAVQVFGAKHAGFNDVETPRPASGEVLVSISKVGICSTDIEIYDGVMAYFTMGMAKYPVIPGHEWAGKVVEVGGDVESFKIGDQVVGECSVGCGKCSSCLAGSYHQCPNRTETGILNRDGGFAQFINFPATFLHKVPDSVLDSAAAMVEPTAIAFNGVKQAGVTPQDEVVIYGDGTIGLMLLQVAQAFGAKNVIVVGATQHRLQKALEMGANHVIDVNNCDPVKELQALGRGNLPSVVLEATGFPQAVEQALNSVRPGGRIVLQGLLGGKKVPVNFDSLVIGDITLRGALGSPGIWPDVIDLIACGSLKPDVIVTHTLPLAEFEKGIELSRQRVGIKVLLEP